MPEGPRRQNAGMTKIAAVQMVSTPNLQANLDAAGRLIAQAAASGAAIVVLPEYFCLLGQRDTDKLAIAESALSDMLDPADPVVSGPGAAPTIQRFLSAAAREHGLGLVGGTLPLRTVHDDRVLNRCCVFAPDGRQAAHYDKIHLFAFDNGRESYDEGRTLQRGATPVALQAAGLRVGLSICYDLRFPELYRALMVPPCDLICVPSAFTHTTGRAHWELLLRARAVENQCYVVAAAQGGTHENGRRTWGHSMIVDPWGEVLAVHDEGEGVVLAEVDATRIAQVRRQLPALAHRRL